MHSTTGNITPFLARLPARLDARLLLPVAMGVGLAIWHGGVMSISLHCLLAVLAMIAICRIRRERLDLALVLLRFIAFLTLMLWLTAMWQGMAWDAALTRALFLGARLGALAGVGFVLSLAVSTRTLGLALTWYLRPVLGDRAWKTGLALALLIHFLPMCLRIFSDLRQSMRLRPIHGGFFRRALLLPTAGLRIMAQRTWKQALAVSARGLDTPGAWTGSVPSTPLQWLAGFGIVCASWSLALI